MRQDALSIFNAAVSSVQPDCLLPKYIRRNNENIWLNDRSFSLTGEVKLFVIGAGKGSAAMAVEVEKLLGDSITGGIVVTPYKHALPLKKIICIEAGHPLPDENSIRAGEEILHLAAAAREKDLIIALISGGASALLADHAPGTNLEEQQALNKLLLHCGATIHEINTVRKHLSLIKGGQLARAAYPATLVSFILSDVVGDPLDVIASGPTVPDPTSFANAFDILKHYDLLQQTAPSIVHWIEKGIEGIIAETPKAGDKIFEKTFNHLIGNNTIALEAAAEKATALGYTSFILTNKLEGEAREQAALFVQHVLAQNRLKPLCILMGGETTVTIKGKGKGGRNQEFVLAAIDALMKTGITNKEFPLILSAGTDGKDGATEVAGAFADATTMEAAQQMKLSTSYFLDANDSYHFFQQVGGHIITGPTNTNVMDIVMALGQGKN